LGAFPGSQESLEKMGAPPPQTSEGMALRSHKLVETNDVLSVDFIFKQNNRMRSLLSFSRTAAAITMRSAPHFPKSTLSHRFPKSQTLPKDKSHP
jgi:hypothetical protein